MLQGSEIRQIPSFLFPYIKKFGYTRDTQQNKSTMWYIIFALLVFALLAPIFKLVGTIIGWIIGGIYNIFSEILDF